jgi:hypothetical protein
LLSHENYRQYNVPIAKKLGGIEYAILLNDMLDQYKHLMSKNMLVSHVDYGDGLMYYTQAQAYERCGISRKWFESGLKLFMKLGFLSTIVKFGAPPKRYFKLDVLAIYDWKTSNKDYIMSQGANRNVPKDKSKCPKGHTNDIYNDSYEDSKDRYPPSPPKNSTLSPSLKKEKIAFFDPLTYKLKNDQPLKQITARSLAKKMKDPVQEAIIRANVNWYEEQIESGVIPRTSHEQFLQFAISKDMASQANTCWKNDAYARFFKDENKLRGLKILKTVVQLDKMDGSKPESISKNLPEKTFCSALDNYHQIMKNKE